ncbi:unnamed protein product [Victoria cruziana]
MLPSVFVGIKDEDQRKIVRKLDGAGLIRPDQLFPTMILQSRDLVSFMSSGVQDRGIGGAASAVWCVKATSGDESTITSAFLACDKESHVNLPRFEALCSVIPHAGCSCWFHLPLLFQGFTQLGEEACQIPKIPKLKYKLSAAN